MQNKEIDSPVISKANREIDIIENQNKYPSNEFLTDPSKYFKFLKKLFGLFSLILDFRLT